MIKDILLDALKHEQQQVLLYMGLNKRRGFAEKWWLDYALETAIQTIRDYRDDRIDLAEAYAGYAQVTRVTTDCSTAFSMSQVAERQQSINQLMNDTLHDWLQRGWIALDEDGLWDWVGNARVNLFGSAA